MNTFLLAISSPDGDIFREKVYCISLRGAEGDLAVMAGHIPFVTTVKPCDVKIVLEDETEKIGKTDGAKIYSRLPTSSARNILRSFIGKERASQLKRNGCCSHTPGQVTSGSCRTRLDERY